MNARLFQHPHRPREVIRSHPAYNLLMELRECKAKDRKDGHLPLWRTEPTDADKELEGFIRIYNNVRAVQEHISAEQYDVMVTYFLGWYESSEDPASPNKDPLGDMQESIDRVLYHREQMLLQEQRLESRRCAPVSQSAAATPTMVAQVAIGAVNTSTGKQMRVQAEVEGVQTDVIVDTGAARSVVNPSLFAANTGLAARVKKKLKPVPLTVISATGEQQLIDGEANLTFRMGDVEWQENVIILSSCPHAVLIGYSSIAAHLLPVSLNKETVSFGKGKPLPLLAVVVPDTEEAPAKPSHEEVMEERQKGVDKAVATVAQLKKRWVELLKSVKDELKSPEPPKALVQPLKSTNKAAPAVEASARSKQKRLWHPPMSKPATGSVELPPVPVHATAVQGAPRLTREELLAAIAAEIDKDPYYGKLKQHLTLNNLPKEQLSKSLRQDCDKFIVQNGCLYRLDPLTVTTGSGKRKLQYLLWLPKGYRKAVMFQHHDSLGGGGHLGERKTYEKVRSRYYWQGLHNDVIDWVKSCPTCAARKTPQHLHPPLTPLPVPSYPFQFVSVDVLGPFVEAAHTGNRYIVVFCDHLTRWVECVPYRRNETAVLARILVERIVCRHGAPETLLSDRGPQFLAQLANEVYRILSVKKVNTAAYHPQTNGLVERFNKTIATMLSCYVDSRHRDWDTYVPYVAMAYNTAVNASTTLSPFMMRTGRRARMPTDAMLLPTDEEPVGSSMEYCNELKEGLRVLQAHGRDQLQKSQQQREMSRGQGSGRTITYEVGDNVLVHNPVIGSHRSKKLLHQWTGPFKILHRMSMTHYQVEGVGGKGRTVAVGRLKKYYAYPHPEADEADYAHHLQDTGEMDAWEGNRTAMPTAYDPVEGTARASGTQPSSRLTNTKEALGHPYGRPEEASPVRRARGRPSRKVQPSPSSRQPASVSAARPANGPLEMEGVSEEKDEEMREEKEETVSEPDDSPRMSDPPDASQEELLAKASKKQAVASSSQSSAAETPEAEEASGGVPPDKATTKRNRRKKAKAKAPGKANAAVPVPPRRTRAASRQLEQGSIAERTKGRQRRVNPAYHVDALQAHQLCTHPAAPRPQVQRPICQLCGRWSHHADQCHLFPRSTLLCFNCGEKGHFSSVCRKPPTAGTLRRRRMGPTGKTMAQVSAGVKCYGCGRFGHVRGECRKERRQRQGRQKAPPWG